MPVIQILAWVGLLQSLQRLNSSVLQACDRTGTLLRYSIVVLAASLVGVRRRDPLGHRRRRRRRTRSRARIVEPYYAWITARVLDVRAVDYARSLAGVAQATLGMAAVVLAAKLWLVSPDLAAGLRLRDLRGSGPRAATPCWPRGGHRSCAQTCAACAGGRHPSPPESLVTVCY